MIFRYIMAATAGHAASSTCCTTQRCFIDAIKALGARQHDDDTTTRRIQPSPALISSLEAPPPMAAMIHFLTALHFTIEMSVSFDDSNAAWRPPSLLTGVTLRRALKCCSAIYANSAATDHRAVKRRIFAKVSSRAATGMIPWPFLGISIVK